MRNAYKVLVEKHSRDIGKYTKMDFKDVECGGEGRLRVALCGLI
jgi:hypothetical protein